MLAPSIDVLTAGSHSGSAVASADQLSDKPWLGWLRCPDCREGSPRPTSSVLLVCDHCAAEFPVVSGRPVLIRHDNAVFPIQSYAGGKPETRTMGPLRRFAAKLVPDISANLATDAMLARFAASLGKPIAWVLVLGCGAQRNVLPGRVPAPGQVYFVYTDIDVASLVDLFCDGHDLPFRDNSFDGVISSAVLEHVMYPERVVAEMHRVLKPGGAVYSEIPFMQQVHEGAYDFTRYSLSGHRRLFNHFRELHSGMVAGPGTSLAWAIENFVLSFISAGRIRLLAKSLARGLFFWLKYFDYWLVDKPQAMDAASCTYFVGVKQNSRVSDDEIIARYVGLKHLRHF